MGQLSFFVPQRDRLQPGTVERAYTAGMECIPWHGKNVMNDNHLVIDRHVDESGCLYIPWLVEGHGEMIVSTTSLMERDEPYNLPVELARGTLNRIRNQLAVWRGQGFTPSAEFMTSLRSATNRFIKSATSQIDDPVRAADEANACLIHGMDAITQLAHDFSGQVLQMRHKSAQRLPTLLGARLDSTPMDQQQAQYFRSAFNTALVSCNWREIEEIEGEPDWSQVDKQVEWCRASGLKIGSAPLLRLNKNNLPDWLYLWEDDYDMIRQSVLGYVQSAVKRYAGKMQIWHCAAGMNVSGALGLPEEYKLRLTVDAIQTVRQHDQRAPVIVSFDQPWAEYLAHEDLDLSPLHFADALVRAELGVAGIGLEINLGYWPGGTLPRDFLEFNRLLDHWSHLGLPLLLFLTLPSSAEDDPASKRNSQPLAQLAGGINSQAQAQFVQRLLPLLLSKQNVHGIFWTQVNDALPHEYAHGGVFDGQTKPKPLLNVFSKLRQQHLT